MLTGLTLPEAIRKGATMLPQTWGHLFLEQVVGERARLDRACAIGGAVVAITGVTEWPRAIDYWTYVGAGVEDEGGLIPSLNISAHGWICPVCNDEMAYDHLTVYDVITHLNDAERWTREAIADYVEQQGWL